MFNVVDDVIMLGSNEERAIVAVIARENEVDDDDAMVDVAPVTGHKRNWTGSESAESLVLNMRSGGNITSFRVR